MNNSSVLRGMATVNYWADDMLAAKKWYSDLLGVAPYFARPSVEQPAYIEFRIGDHQAELGIISRQYAPKGVGTTPGGAVLLWHVDDLEATLERLTGMGAKLHEPITPRGEGFVTASVIDPFGNILGIMHNPHYVEMLNSTKS